MKILRDRENNTLHTFLQPLYNLHTKPHKIEAKIKKALYFYTYISLTPSQQKSTKALKSDGTISVKSR